MATPIRLRTEILSDPAAAWDELEAGITFLEEEIFAQDATYTVTPFVPDQRTSTWVMTKTEIQALEDRMHAVSVYLGIPHLLTTWSGLMPVGYNAMNHFILGLKPQEWIDDGYDYDGYLYDIMPIDYDPLTHEIDWLSMFRQTISPQPLIDLIASVQEYPTPVAGSKYVFLSAPTLGLDVAAIDSTHALIVCNNLNDSYHGRAVMATINGTEISYGTVTEIVAAKLQRPKIVKLNADQAIIVYCEGNDQDGKALIANTTAGTYGAGHLFNLYGYQPAVARLDDTHALIIFRDAWEDGFGTAVIATIDGMDITYSLEFLFNAGLSYDMDVVGIDATHALITYSDNSDSDIGKAVVATISGGTISFSAEQIFNNAATAHTTVTILDSTHAVIGFTDIGNFSRGTVVHVTIAGDTLTFGAKAVYSSSGAFDNNVNTIDSTHVFITHHGGPGLALIGIVTGTDITFGESATFSTTLSGVSASSAPSISALIVAFADMGNSYYGTAAVAALV